ncbi:sensor histidine kinase [Prevotellamassilia timonensis]|uniref:sensor histidine kinase n=1 Tax=Prevotellamassilia timonensis TaxID=1852370 RepID=UPI003A90D2DA
MTYKTKLLLNFTLLFAVFTALLVVFQYNREKQYKRDLLDSRLRSYADMVGETVDQDQNSGDTVRYTDMLRVMPADLRLTVISRMGRVKFESTHHSINEMNNHLTRPEVQAALKNEEGSDIRLSETDHREYFYYAKAFNGYIVRVAMPYDATVQTFMKADNVFLWFVLMLFPIALVLLIYISDRFGQAVSGLRNFMLSADRGLVDYDHITFPHSELGDIGRGIMRKYKQLEESKQQIDLERERLKRHFHYYDEGIAIFSPTRTRIYCNPRFMQYVNVLLDHPTPDINTIWQADAFKPALEFLQLNSGQSASADETPVFKFNTKGGGNTFAVQVLIYGDGGFELSLADVTRAEKSRKLKQQMSNNITHELRTPVSSIRGYIETILDCDSLSDERKHYFLEKAQAQVVRLSDLIRDVALITKTEEAADLMPREQVDMARVVADAQEDLHEMFDRTGMKLHVSLPEHLTINGNYSLVYSIFRNLMENSLRYAGNGKDICISCYNLSTEFAYFSVSDTGQGVPEEHLPRLFERFYRVTEGRTRDNGGTGLGLSIVRNAVLFHHGDISVRNRKGGGLEFLFTLHR